jgi:hypothetical protein
LRGEVGNANNDKNPPGIVSEAIFYANHYSQYNEDGGPRKFEVNAREYMHGSEHQYEANQGNGDAKKHAAPVPLFLILLVVAAIKMSVSHKFEL